jgi:hypothetical protein
MNIVRSYGQRVSCFLRDCRTSLSLANSGMIGKIKNRRRTAERFKNFPQLLQLLINVERYALLHRKGMEIATFLQIAAGQFYLPSYWMPAGIWAFPSGFPIPFKNFQEAFQ